MKTPTYDDVFAIIHAIQLLNTDLYETIRRNDLAVLLEHSDAEALLKRYDIEHIQGKHPDDYEIIREMADLADIRLQKEIEDE